MAGGDFWKVKYLSIVSIRGETRRKSILSLEHDGLSHRKQLLVEHTILGLLLLTPSVLSVVSTAGLYTITMFTIRASSVELESSVDKLNIC